MNLKNNKDIKMSLTYGLCGKRFSKLFKNWFYLLVFSLYIGIMHFGVCCSILEPFCPICNDQMRVISLCTSNIFVLGTLKNPFYISYFSLEVFYLFLFFLCECFACMSVCVPFICWCPSQRVVVRPHVNSET